MTDPEILEDLPPVAHATIIYLGPVAPHWEIRGHFGDSKLIDGFRARVNARLTLLPKHDPQFRRNRERVNRDAERERIRLDWDLGDEEPATAQPAAPAPPRAAAQEPEPVAAVATEPSDVAGTTGAPTAEEE